MRLGFYLVVIVLLMPRLTVADIYSDDPVVAVEQQWADALVHNDREAIANLMDPRFRIVEISDDAPISRERYLAMSGIIVREVLIDPLSITYHGKTAIAVMDYHIDWSLVGSDIEMPSEFRVIDTLHLKEGRWMIISRLSDQPSSKDD